MVMVSLDGAYGRAILQGIADYAERHTKWQYQLEVRLSAEAVRRGGVDGMIIEVRDPPVADAMRKSKIPIITVANVPYRNAPPAVVVDNRAVGRMAVDHLAGLGLKHLAYVPVVNTPASDRRAEGFVERCNDRHLAVDVCDAEIAGDDDRLVEWVRSLPQPVGIFACHDRRALQVARVCRLAGRRIPEDVALLGVDNEIEICRLTDPPLSSIDHGSRRIGMEAARLLDGWMSGGPRPASPTLIEPIRVVSRPSTDLLTLDDPDVVTALRFIRENAGEALKVRDVVRHLAMSRRSLELHFTSAIGRSIHREIVRVRIERAKELLLASDANMAQVAEACGFALPSQFSYVFRRETGVSPLRYRQQSRV